jgi:diadenosine tetraphosphate (Ap4A) HIT family hydrolase
MGYQIATNTGRHGVRLYPHSHLHLLGGTPFRL